MKKKEISKKSQIIQLKTMIKNEYFLYACIAKHKELGRDLNRLAEMEELKVYREHFPFPNTEISMAKCFAGNLGLYERIIEIGKRISISRTLKTVVLMDEVIGHWMEKLDLGKEWKDTFVTYVTTGVLCPPIHNFYMEEKEKRITITLNPDTSIRDIKAVWGDIAKKMEDIWPNFKKMNFSEGMKKNLEEQAKIRNVKNTLTPDFKYQNLTGYEEALIRGKDPQKAKQLISEYRGLKLKVDGVKRQSIKIKERKTDRDIVKELQGVVKGKDLKKAINRLRQQRHRL